MSKFNTATVGSTKTTNLAGGVAFRQSDKVELVSHLLTSFVEDQYYRSKDEGLNRLRELILGQKDKKFAAKAAVYARNEFGMRSVSHAAAAEIANEVKGESWTKNFLDLVVRRPDDMTEILAYYKNVFGEDAPIPNSMKKGFAKALLRFDEYQLKKYSNG